MFDNNFSKCGAIFKILSPTDSWENSRCIHTSGFFFETQCKVESVTDCSMVFDTCCTSNDGLQ